MKISWGKSASDSNREGESGTSGSAHEQEQTASFLRPGQRLSPDWMDDAVTDYARRGGFDNLDGKGKPMQLEESHTDDATLNRILAANQVLPTWLELQHEIRDELGALVTQAANLCASDLDAGIRQLNAKIKKYNDLCPTPILQKPFVSKGNLQIQYSKWI